MKTPAAALQFVGTGEAADPDLPNTSLLFKGRRTLLLDCGYSVPQALWRLTTDPDLLDGIVISHRHADHCFGLPGLLLWLRESGRSRPITVFGGPGVNGWLEQLTDLAYSRFMERTKDLTIETQELTLAGPRALGPVAISCAQSDHGEPNLAVRIDDGDVSVCFSGDGGPTPATEKMYQNATLLVHECYAASPGTSGHAHLAQVLAVTRRAEVGQLALVHLGATEREQIVEELPTQLGDLTVNVPRPGETITLTTGG